MTHDDLIPTFVGEYEIHKEIGRGAMGAIYLARDTLLDRDVALKLVPPELLDEEAKARFIREARALARVAHPNVVTVHRVGEVDRRPYLVTELVRGSSLSEQPTPMPWRSALRLGIGMARGLTAAHRKHVLHRDIKPANVMLDDAGEVKLVDFGLAKIDEGADAIEGGRPDVARRASFVSEASEIVGTPAYMAPETLWGAPATPQSDIYGVGATLYELVTGVSPRGALSDDVPLSSWIAHEPEPIERHTGPGLVDARFSRVIERCLAAAPARRFSSAEALAEALEALVDDGEDTGPLPANPYRGLLAFDAEHQGVFCGREAETRALLRRLTEQPLIVVAGDSGVGKSSLCRAGVLPRWSKAARDAGRSARTVALVPGRRPLDSLANAFDVEHAEAGEDGPAALGARIARSLRPAEELLVLVDQMEELSTLSSPADARGFGQVLWALGRAPRIRVLATLRADFIAPLAALDVLGKELEATIFLLRPMGEEGIRSAIVKPALRKGVTFESDAVVDALARDAVETPGGLPLLEFALDELWTARDGSTSVISNQALRAIGSVAGALARHADRVLDALEAPTRAAARRALIRLAHAGRTRARRTAEELGAGDGHVSAALEALVRGRLLVARSVGDEPTYELAHEALLREWPTLRRWLEETVEQRRVLDEIEEAAELWARRGRLDEETWAGDALDQAVQRITGLGLDLPATARAFIEAGVSRRDRSSRRRRWLFGAAVSTLVLLAGGSTAAAVAFSRKEQEAIAQQEQIRLAAADMGEIDLVIEPFDWDPRLQVPTPAIPSPSLDLRFHAVAALDARTPGRLYGPRDLRRSQRIVDGTALRERFEVRSGPALLEISGRGGDCASSWIFLQRLPGYPDRLAGARPTLRIPVPTCQASFADTVEIPAGEFYRSAESRDGSEEWIDSIAHLPTFHLDRTEVTRAAFAIYGALEPLSGDGAARTAYLDLDRPGGERLPVVGVSAFTASSYCRFLGKSLPTLDQWLKAMRGGLTIGGAPNPDPRRAMPWIGAPERPANIKGDEDGYPNLAPVGSFPLDRSPYGIMDLGGNVSEWSRDVMEAPSVRGLRVILGPNWDIPREYVHFRNMRPDRALDFTNGIRCVRE